MASNLFLHLFYYLHVAGRCVSLNHLEQLNGLLERSPMLTGQRSEGYTKGSSWPSRWKDKGDVTNLTSKVINVTEANDGCGCERIGIYCK
jgi:hypothetical protein